MLPQEASSWLLTGKAYSVVYTGRNMCREGLTQDSIGHVWCGLAQHARHSFLVALNLRISQWSFKVKICT